MVDELKITRQRGGEMEQIPEKIAQALNREMKSKADIHAELFQILKDIALKMEDIEKRLKVVEERVRERG